MTGKTWTNTLTTGNSEGPFSVGPQSGSYQPSLVDNTDSHMKPHFSEWEEILDSIS